MTKLRSKWGFSRWRTSCDDLLNVSIYLFLSRWFLASIQRAAQPLHQNRELGLIHLNA
jgi:hypothetical protein